MADIDIEKFASDIVGRLSEKIDASHAPLRSELAHIRRAQVGQGLAIARVETKQDSQDALYTKLEHRVTELEKIDRRNQYSLGKLAAASTGLGALAGCVSAWFARHNPFGG